MGRKRNSAKAVFYNEEIEREFEDQQQMKKLKIDGPKAELQLNKIEPLTDNQKRVFEEYPKGDNLVLYGRAGTGKSFILLYLSLQEIFEKRYEKLIIVRSAVPSRSLGYLPGTEEEKIEIYKLPYISMCAELFDRKDAYTRLEKRGYIEFTSSSYLRGLTYSNCILLIEEAQNFSFSELDTTITRIGFNSKLMICGDFEQSDLIRKDERQGCHDFFKILNKMNEFTMIQFTIDDICRSPMVKSYLIQKQIIFKNEQ